MDDKNWPEPIADRLLVRPIERNAAAGVILNPETINAKPTEGVVLAVGPGKMTEFGARIEPQVRVGDRVMFPEIGGADVEVGGELLKMMREDEVQARYPNEAQTSEGEAQQ